VRENAPGPAEQLPGFFQRDDRVFESRLRGLFRDRVRFFFLFSDSLFERRLEMLVLNLVERRKVERQCALGQERVGGGSHVWCFSGVAWRRRWRGLGCSTRRDDGAAE